jgi:DNA recombination protein RmuC
VEPLTILLLVSTAVCAIAAVLGWMRAATRDAEARAASQARDTAVARLAGLEQDESRLRNTFEALAGRALQAQSEQFLTLAEQRLSTQQARADASIQKERREVDALVKPIGEALAKTREELAKIEKAREGAYHALSQQVRGFQEASVELRTQAARLTDALRRPNVRGRYGEIQLQRVVELAGMRDWCDFSTQAASKNGAGEAHRPDLIVRLPNGRVLAVDAKCSIDGYLDALEAPDAAVRDAAMLRYATNVVDQVLKLGARNYWADFDASPELVVMFVPGDQFIDAALQARPDLVEIAAQKNIVLASPATLIGLLRAVALGWREQKVSDNAAELIKLGKELHERSAKVLEFAGKVGENLRRSVDAYNEFASSVDKRLMPTLRKFEEHDARSAKTLVELEQLERVPVRIESAADEIVPVVRITAGERRDAPAQLGE